MLSKAVWDEPEAGDLVMDGTLTAAKISASCELNAPSFCRCGAPYRAEVLTKARGHQRHCLTLPQPAWDELEPADLVMNGTLAAAGCGILVRLSATTTHIERYYAKAVNYTLMITGVSFFQVNIRLEGLPPDAVERCVGGETGLSLVFLAVVVLLEALPVSLMGLPQTSFLDQPDMCA